MDLDDDHLPVFPAPSQADILLVEDDPDLEVTSLIPIHRKPESGWGVWPDLCHDERVLYMEQLISDHQPFHKHMWPGGDTSAPSKCKLSPSKEMKPRKSESKSSPSKAMKTRKPESKSLKPRKSSRNVPSTRKQRRISNYFPHVGLAGNLNDEVLKLLSEMSAKLSNLESESKQLRKNHHQTHTACQTEASPQTFDKGCQTESLTENVSPMDEDDTLSETPIVSQYGAHQYGSISSTSPPKPPLVLAPLLPPHHVDDPPVHSSPSHTSPIHIAAPIHITPLIHISSPIHITSPVPTTPLFTTTTDIKPNQSTLPCFRTRSVIYDISDHPNSPELHHWMYQGLEIFDAVSPDPPSLTQPKYDSSHNQASRRLPFTPDTSPDKSGDSKSGFLVHARATNAFSATASSKPLSDEQQEDIDIVELSEGSPGRPRPRHQPTCEENQLAGHLMRCKSIPAVDVISQLPQIEWDLFERFISDNKDVFHITPSEFEFTNNFLLQLAEPKHWTSAYVDMDKLVGIRRPYIVGDPD
ncbi:unnamed protein product [Eruca vesicaria subsp. sativa]|uniref:Uncharacterized protein n=1 Tax=Eruca vesicaria subsp. sativa TaxID=29727 RepID=A0ABC8JVM1_ERUVS|nr:unnamed protein product [Eruca vesicaria subsp. sativa]